LPDRVCIETEDDWELILQSLLTLPIIAIPEATDYHAESLNPDVLTPRGNEDMARGWMPLQQSYNGLWDDWPPNWSHGILALEGNWAGCASGDEKGTSPTFPVANDAKTS
jgi:hypothetical protein